MGARHDPVAWITESGLIAVACTAGDMEVVTGFKQTCMRAWTSHITYARVSASVAGALNLDMLTDPSDGPATRRDLSRFPPKVVERMLANDPTARRLPEKPAIAWLYGLPEESEGAD